MRQGGGRREAPLSPPFVSPQPLTQLPCRHTSATGSCPGSSFLDTGAKRELREGAEGADAASSVLRPRPSGCTQRAAALSSVGHKNRWREEPKVCGAGGGEGRHPSPCGLSGAWRERQRRPAPLELTNAGACYLRAAAATLLYESSTSPIFI